MRLGLFVVSHLAQRHNIKVRLRASPYGGVQAIVLLPTTLITDEAPALEAAPAAKNPVLPSRSITRGSTTRPLRVAARVPAGARNTEDQATEGVSDEDKDALSTGPTAGSTSPLGLLPRRDPGANAFPGHQPEITMVKPAPAAEPEQDLEPEQEPVGYDIRPELPRRTPQANLAPQLLDDNAPSTPEPPADEDAERSTRLRRTMSAFQQGTRRGRLAGQQQRTNDTEHHTDKDSNTP
ncbi:hypothetical protein Nans01_48890 [Nocardiopsis ansamitocini]|uniref:histidine kinase n=1 Tax=Nocardiopsis ansamitocini TaxID=1670832 RepID=A0A9W6ULD1_9ACTN|nr:hypothetical protein Nans01_48890 [Nocardiopsis ansamitocini]